MSTNPRIVKLHVFRTINLGNYENIKVEAGIEETIGPDETYEEAYARVWREVKTAFLKALADEDIKKESVEAPIPPDPSTSRYRIKTVDADT